MQQLDDGVPSGCTVALPMYSNITVDIMDFDIVFNDETGTVGCDGTDYCIVPVESFLQ